MKVPDLRKLSGLSGWVRNVNPGVLLKKEAERELIGRREEGHVPPEAKCWHAGSEMEQGTRTHGRQGAWLGMLEEKQTFSPEARRDGPCPHLDFSPAMLIPNPPSGMLREENLCCFKPRNPQ